MLIKKMMRDVWKNKVQFLAIFIMAVLGALIYAGLNCEWFTMKNQADAYYEKTNLADIWIYDEALGENDIEKIKAIKGVEYAEGRFVINGSEKTTGNSTELQLNFVTDGKISDVLTQEGDKFSNSKEGIWIDYQYASANKISVGTKITISVRGLEITEKVRGLILSPEYVYNVKDDSEMIPDHQKFGYAYLPYSIIENLGINTYTEILISADEKSVEKVKKNISGNFSTVFDRNTYPSVTALNNEIQQHKALGNIFPVIFLAIAVLSILTTMTRLTKSQRIQIGTLMSLGFKKGRILRHYVSYGFFISLIGGCIGILIGQSVIPKILFEIQKPIYTLPSWDVKIPTFNFIMVALIVLLCTATNYFACRKELKDVPAETLRTLPPKTGKHNIIENTKIWNKMGFNFQWNVRDICRNKIRTLMAIIGCLGCMALLLCAFGMNDTINNVGDRMYNELFKFQNKVIFKEDADINEIEEYNATLAGQLIQEENIEMQYGENKKNGLLTVDSGGKCINYENDEGMLKKLPDTGVAISYKMSKLLGIEKGEKIKWRIIGDKHWYNAEVKAFYEMPIGQGICMSTDAYQQLERFKPNAMLIDKKISSSEVNDSVVDTIKSKDEFIDAFNSMLDTMKMIVLLLIVFAVLLGIIVLYNLGILYYTERFREFATLKVLGFKSKRIRSLMVSQNIWLTLIGAILGIPIGFLVLSYMTNTLGDNLDMTPKVFGSSILICFTGTILVSLLVNLLLANNIKKIDMVSALKSIE